MIIMPKKKVAKKTRQSNAGISKPQQKLKGKGCCSKKPKNTSNCQEEETTLVAKNETTAASSTKGKGYCARKAKDVLSRQEEEKATVMKTEATEKSPVTNASVDASSKSVKVKNVKGKKVVKKIKVQKPSKSVKFGKEEPDVEETKEEAIVKKSPKRRGSSTEKGDSNLQDEAVEGSTKSEKDDKKVKPTRKRKGAKDVEHSPSPKRGTLQVKKGTMVRSPAKVTKTIKAISWNVAGIRAWVKKSAHEILKNESPDLLGLQEIKCNAVPEEIDLKGYSHYLESSAEKSGYAGVLLLAKQKPIKIIYGSQLRDEASGRMIVAEFEAFYFINSYVPNSGRGLVNLAKRKKWEDWFIEEIKKWDAIKPVIYSGDLNVAHEEIDLAKPKNNRNKTAGFTDQERNDFTRLLEAGFVDVYRKLNPDKEGAYTFWSNMHEARSKNVGWRLDYFVVSDRIVDRVTRCEILSDIPGSDHCPIILEITF